ncbi:hypothetical protein ACLB2K_046141 [Fragaria x ananassa]
MNRYMKDKLLSSRVRLIELVPQLDKSNICLRNKVVKEDFRSNNSTHVLSTGLRKLEKHASTLYTDNVFQLICVEIDRVGELITSEIMHLNSCRVYITSSYNNDEENECTTTYYHRSSDPRLVCSCQLFEHEGIPCSHLFNVMKHERMREIPRSLILKRWTKEAKSEVQSTVPKDNTPSETLRSARHGDLTYLGSKISYLASQTEEGTAILKKELNKLEPILAEVLNQQKDMSDISDPCNNLLRDPVKVRSKGRQFKKAAALKWNTFDPSQKAQYSVSTLTHSDSIPTVSKDKSKDSRFMATRCSPKIFLDIVSKFSKDQIAAVNEMGFGTLLQLSCTRIRHDLCSFLVDKFDTENCLIWLHGKTMKLCSSEFQHIIDIPEGGTNIDFSDSNDNSDTKVFWDFFCWRR